MVRCISCQPQVEKKLDLEHILKLIQFNVGHIIYLEQVQPTGHHYGLEIISGNSIVVHNLSTGHEDLVNLKEFKERFSQCVWAKLEAITW